MRQALTVRQDGAQVQIIIGGRLVAQMGPAAAREVAAALKHQAGLAEEIVQRERIVIDEAILLRAGVPFGLIHNPHLAREASKEAAWNSHLRRYMPGGVKSAERFGVPAVVRHPRRSEEAN